MYTFVTGGMSDLPMTIPKGAVEAGVSERAELMVCLPASWPVPDEAHVVSPWADDDAYVPIRSLKELARLPHEYATWLGFGHSIPNGDPPRRLTADTALCGWIVLPPMTVPSSFRQLTIDGAGTIDIFAIIAVHADEMHHKLAHGTEALFHGFDHHNVNELLDLQRPSSLR